MDKSAPIERRNIIEQQLPPHLQFGLQVVGSTVNTSGSGSSKGMQRLAGESINAGWAVGIKATDGKVYHASVVVADELPAVAIADNLGSAGSLITLLQDSEKVISGIAFSITNPVWLCSPVLSSPNVTTVLPTNTSGRWYQRLGMAEEIDKFIISIQTARAIP